MVVLLVKGFVQGTLQTELVIARFVKRFKALKCFLHWQIVVITFNSSLKNCVFVVVLLVEGASSSAKGAGHFVAFVEYFDAAT